MKDIRERALLVQFKDRVWIPSKLDKEVSSDVAKRNNAAGSGVGFYKKHLLPKAALKERLRISNATRAFHYQNTLPWMDDGMRILPARNLKKYMERMRQLKKEAHEAEQEFFANYDKYVKEAKNMLGKLFRPDEYPTMEAVKDRFSFDILVLPIPEVKDWRVDINQKEMDALRKEAVASLAEVQKRAILDLWQRLYEVVERVKEKLGEDDSIFRDSLVGNVNKMLEVLPTLNITDDPELNKISKEVQSKLVKVTPAVLRENPTERKKVHKDAAAIMKKMDVYMRKAK